MKMNVQILAVAALLLSSLATSHAQLFDSGNLVVLQVGDGSQTLGSSGNSIFLDQFTTSGSFVDDVAIPSSSGASPLIIGNAGSDGALNLSANGEYLVFGGYAVSYGYTNKSLANASAASIPRGVATVDAYGNYNRAVTTTSFYGGNNMRSGASDGNGNYWGGGAASGTVYLGNGTAAQLSSVNSIVIQDIGGNLLYSTTKATTAGIYEISGVPTSGTATPNLLLADANPYDFAFNSAMTVAYVANNSGGIDRFDYNGSSWNLSYTLDSGTAMQGLAVDFGSTTNIFATTADGTTLLEITDTGTGSTPNTLSTTSANELYRGLSFAPEPAPEPSTCVLIGIGFAGLWNLRRSRKS